MLNKVRQYIEQHHLLDYAQTYLIALSGGSDSVALLRIMLDLGYQVEAAHCNFQLRGEESDRDENFVRNLCQKLGVNLHTTHFDTQTYATDHHISIEMAARELRYNYFSELLHTGSGDVCKNAVLVAHHKDDSVETILINLIRGTGPQGLIGINPCTILADPSNLKVIRPLLCLTRTEILAYLQSVNQDYVTDSTNLEDDVIRNKIRLNILPLLKEINPSFTDALLRTADNLNDALQNNQEHQLFTILKDFGFNGTLVRRISDTLDSATGKQYQSPTHNLFIDRGTLRIIEKVQCNNALENNPQLSIINSQLTDRFCAYLDADKVEMPLTLRKVMAGDKFIPFGMTGRKLISDYLTDIKMPLDEKQKQMVVVDATGNIIWLVNQRIDNRYRITSQTKNILSISLVESTTNSKS